MARTQKQKKDKSAGNTHSGRSVSSDWPTGRRRVRLDSGATLAPRSQRRRGKVFLSDCKQVDLRRLGLPASEVEQGIADENA